MLFKTILKYLFKINFKQIVLDFKTLNYIPGVKIYILVFHGLTNHFVPVFHLMTILVHI